MADAQEIGEDEDTQVELPVDQVRRVSQAMREQPLPPKSRGGGL